MKRILSIFMLWVVIFVASYAVLTLVGLVPLEFMEVNSRIVEIFSLRADALEDNSTEPSSEEDESGASSVTKGFSETMLPERVVIEKIQVNAPVMNPETRDIAVLDQALLKGVVRYPGSGGLDDESNMFLFGHSTSLQNVRNTAFQALNRLGELQIGDTIKVISGKTEYRYKVITVAQVDQNEALVEFSAGEKLITLSTCDTFGQRSDRFVVTARFVQAMPVSGSR